MTTYVHQIIMQYTLRTYGEIIDVTCGMHISSLVIKTEETFALFNDYIITRQNYPQERRIQ